MEAHSRSAVGRCPKKARTSYAFLTAAHPKQAATPNNEESRRSGANIVVEAMRFVQEVDLDASFAALQEYFGYVPSLFRCHGPRAGTADIVINWRFTDTHESLVSTLEHGALTSISGKTAVNAMTTVTTTRTVFESVILGQRTIADAMEHSEITTIGDAKAVSGLWSLLIDFETGFPVVEPGR